MREDNNDEEYLSAPDQWRWAYTDFFGYFYKFEGCYSERELQLREKIIQYRKQSGIDKKFLTTDKRWFDENDFAFELVNDKSYILNIRKKPIDRIDRDDFIVTYVDQSDLCWKQIYSLEQEVGEYLTKRNKFLSIYHLNDPINFFYLDVMSILRKLATDSNEESVLKNLDHLVKYIDSIKILISSSDGTSDKLFLEKLKKKIEIGTINKIKEHIKSKTLADQFEKLGKDISNVISRLNSLAHYALSSAKVNQHTHSEYRDMLDSLSKQQLETNPEVGLVKCAYDKKKQIELHEPEKSTEAESTQVALANPQQLLLTDTLNAEDFILENNPFYFKKDVNGKIIYEFDRKVIEFCPTTKFINYLDEDQKILYAELLAHIEELRIHHKAIAPIISILIKVGEKISVHILKDDINNFLKILKEKLIISNSFFEKISDISDMLYQKAIKEQQDMGVLSCSFYKYLSYNDHCGDLENFINNQDIHTKINENPPKLSSTLNEIADCIANIESIITNQYEKDSASGSMLEVEMAIKQLKNTIQQIQTMDNQIKGEPVLQINAHDKPKPNEIDVKYIGKNTEDSKNYDVEEVCPLKDNLDNGICFPEHIATTAQASSASRLSPPLSIIGFFMSSLMTPREFTIHSPLVANHSNGTDTTSVQKPQMLTNYRRPDTNLPPLPFDSGAWSWEITQHEITKAPLFTYQVFKHEGEQRKQVGKAVFYGHPVFCRSKDDSSRHNVIELQGVLAEYEEGILSQSPYLEEICADLPPTDQERLAAIATQSAYQGALRGVANVLGNGLLKKGYSAATAQQAIWSCYYTSLLLTKLYARYDAAAFAQNPLSHLSDIAGQAAVEMTFLLALQWGLQGVSQLSAWGSQKAEQFAWNPMAYFLRLVSDYAHYGVYAYEGITQGLLQTGVSLFSGIAAQKAIESVANPMVNFLLDKTTQSPKA